MTRAIDRLIVSGSIDRDAQADEKTPIGWVLGRLDCAAELADAGEAPVELERDGARLLVRLDAGAALVDAPAPVEPVLEAEIGQLALFSPIPRRRCRRSHRARADPGASRAAAA